MTLALKLPSNSRYNLIITMVCGQIVTLFLVSVLPSGCAASERLRSKRRNVYRFQLRPLFW